MLAFKVLSFIYLIAGTFKQKNEFNPGSHNLCLGFFIILHIIYDM